jgi:hypothetical protein
MTGGVAEEEMAYYRAVEDCFAALRGTPFLLRPKDFALLRSWWSGGVPLAAVLAGLSESFARQRGRGDDPISSLSYCRHAVARHARRLRDARAGAGPEPALDVTTALTHLVEQVRQAAQAWHEQPAVAAGLNALVCAIATLPSGSSAGAVDETLAGLELAALETLEAALPQAERDALAGAVEAELTALPAADREVLERTRRAMRVKLLRRRLGLPRLELNTRAG